MGAQNRLPEISSLPPFFKRSNNMFFAQLFEHGQNLFGVPAKGLRRGLWESCKKPTCFFKPIEGRPQRTKPRAREDFAAPLVEAYGVHRTPEDVNGSPCSRVASSNHGSVKGFRWVHKEALGKICKHKNDFFAFLKEGERQTRKTNNYHALGMISAKLEDHISISLGCPQGGPQHTTPQVVSAELPLGGVSAKPTRIPNGFLQCSLGCLRLHR